MKLILAIIGIALAAWLLWPVTEALGAAGMGLIIGGVGVLVVVVIIAVLFMAITEGEHSHVERMADINRGHERWTAISHEGDSMKQITRERW